MSDEKKSLVVGEYSINVSLEDENISIECIHNTSNHAWKQLFNQDFIKKDPFLASLNKFTMAKFQKLILSSLKENADHLSASISKDGEDLLLIISKDLGRCLGIQTVKLPIIKIPQDNVIRLDLVISRLCNLITELTERVENLEIQLDENKGDENKVDENKEQAANFAQAQANFAQAQAANFAQAKAANFAQLCTINNNLQTLQKQQTLHK